MKSGQLIALRPVARTESLGDDALAAACATGDRASLALVYEHHVDAVYRFIARAQGSDPDTIEDLVQATFMAAFKSAGSFRGPKLQSWLFGIACNVMRTHVRKEVARRRIVHAYGEEPPADARSPEDVDVMRVRSAIEQLPEKYRDAILLVDMQGERGSDAAQALGIPEGTLWRRLSEGRVRLRELLGGAR
jgi:RNA polymerase sigma-70 factor, ECF subfamily